MFKNIIIILGLLLHVSASETEAILELDSYGHTVTIWDLVVTKDKKRVVSGSADKSVKIWDIESGKLIRRIDGEIRSAIGGAVYAIALSPDNRYLAVGGYLDNFDGSNYKEIGKIRIYDFRSGRLIKLLYGHEEAVFDLSFSDDGKYLASASEDNRIWDVENDFALKAAYTVHDDVAYAIKMLKVGDDYHIYSGAHDHFIVKYSLNKEKVINELELEDNIYYMAFNTKHIATYADNGESIQIFDHDFNLIKAIDIGEEPQVLAYSPSGRYLLVGAASYPYNQLILDAKNLPLFGGSYRVVTSFEKHTNLVKAGAFIDDKRVVTGGGGANIIYVWDRKSAKKLQMIKGVSNMIWGVGINGKNIAYSKRSRNSDEVKAHQGGLQARFNLDTLRLSPNKLKMHTIQNRYKDYRLSHAIGGEYDDDEAGILVLSKGKERVMRIERDASDGYIHKVYGFYKNMIISGGQHGHLNVYDFDGNEVASLVGHNGTVLSLATENNILVSGSEDHTIKIWDLSHLEETMYPTLTLFTAKGGEWVLYDSEGYYISSAQGDKYLGYHINQGKDKEAKFITAREYFISHYDKERIERHIEALFNPTTNKKRVQSRGVNINFVPPTLSLVNTDYIDTDKKRVKVDVRVDNRDTNLTLAVTADYRKSDFSIFNTTVQGESLIYSLEIPLYQHTNRIEIFAQNTQLISKAIPLHVDSSASFDTPKSSLYILSIGASTQREDDATLVANAINESSVDRYKNIQSHVLSPSNLSVKSLRKLFKEVQAKAKREDSVVLFLEASIVKSEEGKLSILIGKERFDYEEFKIFIQTLQSKVMVFVDTLHVNNDSANADNTYIAKDLNARSSKAYIMMASSFTNRTYADSRKKEGKFAQAIASSFESLSSERTINLKDLDKSVKKELKKATHSKQESISTIDDVD